VSDASAAGAGSNEAGGTQTTDSTQSTASTGEEGKTTDSTQATAGADEGKKADGDTKPNADEVSFKAELPEGVDLDQASLDEFTKIVKDKALSPSERAQKLFDLAAKRETDRAEAFVKTVQGWGEAVAADKELGNAEAQAAMRTTISTFGTPELQSLLNSTGFGNHPEVVRFVHKVTKALSEDAIHRSRGDAPAKAKDPATVLYDKTPN
jgi:hypothetical protein